MKWLSELVSTRTRTSPVSHCAIKLVLALCILTFAIAGPEHAPLALPSPMTNASLPVVSPVRLSAPADPTLSAPDLSLGQPVQAALDETGGCEDHTLRSNSLGIDLWVSIYLPPGYDDPQNDKRYPVIYLLSGLGGNFREWAYDYNLCGLAQEMIATREIPPMIIVMPSGNAKNPQEGYGGYWLNHAPEGFTCPEAVAGLNVSDGKRWGDFVWNDLVQVIDANFRTLPRAASRAIGGLSAGGQAALTHALMHPDIFGVVGAHAPSQRRADCSVAFFGDADFYKQFDPFELVANSNVAASLAIWLDEAEHSVWLLDNQAFNSLLTVSGVEHEWHIYPGEHNPPYWQNHIADYLRWYAAHLVQ